MPDIGFRELLVGYFDELRRQVTTEQGDWMVKGFIDIYQRVYTISLDTKVLSKVLELLMFPVIKKFALEHNYQIILARQQNQYPDLSLISPDGEYYAVDIKTTYRKSLDKNGLEGAGIIQIDVSQLQTETDVEDISDTEDSDFQLPNGSSA